MEIHFNVFQLDTVSNIYCLNYREGIGISMQNVAALRHFSTNEPLIRAI